MHAVIRTYSGKGAEELIDVIEKNKEEVERLIRAVKGFVSYSLVRTTGGGFTVSVSKPAPTRAVGWARDWIANNTSNTGAGAPTISEGEVILHLK